MTVSLREFPQVADALRRGPVPHSVIVPETAEH